MHKKYLESPEPTVPHDLPQKKIIPRTLLISPTFPLAGPFGSNFFTSFLVKRKYCRNIPLDESLSDHGMGLIGNHLRDFRRVCLKMKYLRSIQIISCLTSRYMNNYQVMCGIRSINIEFIVGVDSCLDTVERIRKQFKEFARFDLVKLKIKIFCCTSFSITDVVAKIIEGLRSMNNLKEFSFEIQMSHILGVNVNFKDTSKKQISSKIPLHLKRLNKIEKLQITFKDPAKHIPESLKTLVNDFSHLRNLKSVTCLAVDLAHGKQIIDSLQKTQMLTSVTFYHFFEPNDILLLAMKLPNLKSITIKDDWLITSKDMPSLSLMDCNGLNILQLNVEVPLSIYSKEDVEFVCDFLSAFKQIKSLSLSIESGGNEFVLGPLCKRISTFSHLEQLKLGILVTNKGILSQFLAGIDRLTNLKKISLTLKREFRQKWDCEIQEISHTLKSFIQQSKSLEELSINWDKFTEKCAECLKMILSEINNLNSFCLAYFPGSKKHGKEHESILKAIEGLLIKTTTEIKKVTLVTQCDTYGDFKCNYKLGILKSVLENNMHIKEFLHFVNSKTALDDDHFV